MEIVSYIITLLFIFWLGTRILKSLSRGNKVKTVPSSIPSISGVFTLILYGNDLETVAILGKEGERYTFEPFAPEFKYTVKKGVQAKEAIAEAETFISRHSSFHQSRISGIVDERGNTLGYEFRPLYLPISIGTEDVLDVNYKMEANKVIVYINLKPSIEKKLSS